MESTQKITKEQLDVIVGQQRELNSLLSNIGLLETQKHELLHKIAEVNRSTEEFKSELQSEYGNINISIADGSYTRVEEQETSPKNDEVQFEEVQ